MQREAGRSRRNTKREKQQVLNIMAGKNDAGHDVAEGRECRKKDRDIAKGPQDDEKRGTEKKDRK